MSNISAQKLLNWSAPLKAPLGQADGAARKSSINQVLRSLHYHLRYNFFTLHLRAKDGFDDLTSDIFWLTLNKSGGRNSSSLWARLGCNTSDIGEWAALARPELMVPIEMVL
jgi:hypothetical protein